MPVYEFDENSRADPDTFSRLLREGDSEYDPLEELLRLERELSELERHYQAENNETLSSAEFYERYRRGEMGDALPVIKWAGRYRLYQNLKQTISDSLQLVIAEISSFPTIMLPTTLR